MLPYVCPIISLQRLRIRSTHPEDHREQRITLNTEHTLHCAHSHPCCYALCFVLLCFPSKVCVSSGSSKIPITPPEHVLTKQNMSVTGEGLEMWAKVTQNSILPKACLKHSTSRAQDQLDDNINKHYETRPQVKTTIPQELAQDHRLTLKSHTRHRPTGSN